jgi:hypothetical protein
LGLKALAAAEFNSPLNSFSFVIQSFQYVISLTMLLEALSKSEDCFMTSEGSQCTKKVIAQVSIAESAEKTKFVVL